VCGLLGRGGGGGGVGGGGGGPPRETEDGRVVEPCGGGGRRGSAAYTTRWTRLKTQAKGGLWKKGSCGMPETNLELNHWHALPVAWCW
jgi:hypothetical protein